MLRSSLACAALHGRAANAADRPVKIVALGDSLTAGYGLDRADAFPEKLEKALKAKGVAVAIENAGVSGDTASGGLSRLDWSVADGTDAVILELGANDMLRGVDPKVTRAGARDDPREAESAQDRGAALRHARRAQYGRGLSARLRRNLSRSRRQIRTRLLSVLPGRRCHAGEIRLQDGIHPNAAGVSQIVSGDSAES